MPELCPLSGQFLRESFVVLREPKVLPVAMRCLVCVAGTGANAPEAMFPSSCYWKALSGTLCSEQIPFCPRPARFAVTLSRYNERHEDSPMCGRRDRQGWQCVGEEHPGLGGFALSGALAPPPTDEDIGHVSAAVPLVLSSHRHSTRSLKSRRMFCSIIRSPTRSSHAA